MSFHGGFAEKRVRETGWASDCLEGAGDEKYGKWVRLVQSQPTTDLGPDKSNQLGISNGECFSRGVKKTTGLSLCTAKGKNIRPY